MHNEQSVLDLSESPIKNGSVVSELRDVCAKFMGYPAEVFEEQSDLEADLGIDSIKQIELEVVILKHFNLTRDKTGPIMAPTFGELVANVAAKGNLAR